MRFTILQESESRSVISYHEEDIKREPTLFEQAMQGFKEENSDDDLSEEEEDHHLCFVVLLNLPQINLGAFVIQLFCI
jgi:hypothetical protein